MWCPCWPYFIHWCRECFFWHGSFVFLSLPKRTPFFCALVRCTMLNASEAGHQFCLSPLRCKGSLQEAISESAPTRSSPPNDCIRNRKRATQLNCHCADFAKQELSKHLHQLCAPAPGIRRACHNLILQQQGMADPSCLAHQKMTTLVSYVCQSPVNVAIWWEAISSLVCNSCPQC